MASSKEPEFSTGVGASGDPDTSEAPQWGQTGGSVGDTGDMMTDERRTCEKIGRRVRRRPAPSRLWPSWPLGPTASRNRDPNPAGIFQIGQHVLVASDSAWESRREQLERWSKEPLTVYGVVGLRPAGRGRLGGASQSTSAMVGGREITAAVSQVHEFESDAGAMITVSSHRDDCDERYDWTREWVLANLHRRSARERSTRFDHSERAGSPEGAIWEHREFEVDRRPVAFEVCRLDGPLWGAVARIGEIFVSVSSEGVPEDSVRIENLETLDFPPLRAPDLGGNGEAVLAELDARFLRVPFQRVRRDEDHWALLDIEHEHVSRLAVRDGLTPAQADALDAYWETRLNERLKGVLDRIEAKWQRSVRTTPFRRRLGHGMTYRLWNNTVGPGARSWFGNRYATIRHRTFRIRWRP